MSTPDFDAILADDQRIDALAAGLEPEPAEWIELAAAWRRWHEHNLKPVLDVDTALRVVAAARKPDDPDVVR